MGIVFRTKIGKNYKIQHQDLCLLPSKSYLHIYGRLTKEDAAAPVERTRFVNNAICHLFEEIRYELNGVEIDRAKNVGLTSLMKNYVSQKPSQWPLLENAGWLKKDTMDSDETITNANGLSDNHCEWKDELILTRSKTDVNAILQRAITVQNPEEKYKITLQKIEWLIPYVKVFDERKVKLLNFIGKDTPIGIGFRTWELYEYPLLPTSSKHVWVVKTSNHYPYGNMNLDIDHNQFSTLYNMYVNFQDSFYGKEPEPLLTRSEFLKKAPLIVIDCSKQNEYLKSGPVDIRLEFESASHFPANTSAYCLILHDRIVEYNPISGGVRKLM
ncbi:uncharacterized protein LOC107046316 [Diachasma alloeum]|uniref:uncharacterized protein LOC107046316 n=1 Tax=Diachasma alloeum TaxID=454923 RepID=UPI000738137B|nr:uncharacterized protein LOC107046316 [Diachasma alloeum]